MVIGLVDDVIHLRMLSSNEKASTTSSPRFTAVSDVR
jgi:lysyl-tRNA synthetase class II